jgi:mycobactin phenyloxazoline synthetase
VVRRLRAEAPKLRFAGLGGATETPVHNTIFEVTGAIPADWAALPFGVPLPNNACRVVDDTGADCPDWVPGELWVSGRGLARGYRGRPELTAERFVNHDGRIWYRTGDLVRYRPDGTLEFVGRADHRVKISGYRVELGEIETALRRVRGVRTAVAALIPVSGESDVLAAQVCTDDTTLTAERIRQRLADLVPAYMVPHHITVVERIGFTDAGKLDRRAVARDLRTAVSQAQRPGHRSPTTPLESALALIVGDLLGRENIGIDDDFFALGGDSVLATQAVARIRAWLDAPDIIVADIFANRTVSALAAVLSACENDPRRLDQVAELYLEVIGMDAESVLAAARQPAKSYMTQ